MFQKTVSSLNNVGTYGKNDLLTLTLFALPADPSRNKAEKVHLLMSLTMALVVGWFCVCVCVCTGHAKEEMAISDEDGYHLRS